MNVRYFTPETASVELSRLRPAAERMCQLYRLIAGRRPARIVCDQPVEHAYFSLVARLHATLAEISRSGVQVKDMQSGLLDFPARREGRPVLLCWKVGEPALCYWHELGSGFSGRQPVADDGRWDDA